MLLKSGHVRRSLCSYLGRAALGVMAKARAGDLFLCCLTAWPDPRDPVKLLTLGDTRKKRTGGLRLGALSSLCMIMIALGGFTCVNFGRRYFIVRCPISVI